jgi:hypothetical protein
VSRCKGVLMLKAVQKIAPLPFTGIR